MSMRAENLPLLGGATANRVAKWDATTSSWSPLGTGVQNGLNSAVYALAIDGDNNVYAGGEFTSVGGVTANKIAKWDATTSSWSPLGTGGQNGLCFLVMDLAIDGDNNVYAGGLFTSVGGVTANYIAKWDATTSSWSPLGTGVQNGLNNAVWALAIDGDNNVYAGGEFASAGGEISSRIAQWKTLCSINKLVITEFMADPAAVSDGAGEWFEVHNPTDNDIDMGGYVISDADSDSHTILGSLIVPAGGYIVLGRDSDMMTNGGVTIDYQYSGITMDNTTDELILDCPDGHTIDSIGWTSALVSAGAATSLKSCKLDAISNDDPSNWLFSGTAYGEGDLGTPGSAN